MRLIYWTEFAAWLRCRELHRLRFQLRVPAPELPSAAAAEGSRIHDALGHRLALLAAGKSYSPGNSRVLREYHRLYAAEDTGHRWEVEKTLMRPIGADISLAARADAIRPGLLRETKTITARNFAAALARYQLRWALLLAGPEYTGELDLIYLAGYDRASPEFLRQPLTLGPDEQARMLAEVQQMAADTAADPELPRVRNPHSCPLCPYQPICWNGKETVYADSTADGPPPGVADGVPVALDLDNRKSA